MNLEELVKEAIQTIRPMLQNDGGDIEFVKMEEKKVYVKLHGACATCAFSAMTLKNGVEKMLRTDVDENIEVINLTFAD